MKTLLDQLIGLLRAPWMDKTENLLIKINRTLDGLHKLLDWRDPSKCRAVTGVLATSALLHLWIPFSQFLFFLNGFLFLFWTPVWEWGVKLGTLPFTLSKRLSSTRAMRAAAVEIIGDDAPLEESGPKGCEIGEVCGLAGVPPTLLHDEDDDPNANGVVRLHGVSHPLLVRLLVPLNTARRIKKSAEKKASDIKVRGLGGMYTPPKKRLL